ncbi:MAG: peptide ABC transporter ATP-binding protein [Acidimicrobiaceae bacterium]|nr:peptide ABC transporter ATP-binding protein [Acidimicrobiaceae bacterium]
MTAGLEAENAVRLPALSVRDLRVLLPDSERDIELVRGVSFEVAAGECLGLVGESGAGKSLTGYAAMGLVERSGLRLEGTVNVADVCISDLGGRRLSRIRGQRISMIFQEPSVSLNPAFRVGSQIAEVVRVHRRTSRREAWDRAIEALRLAGVPNPERRAREYPHTLSGGLKQRAMIAMAISCEPEVLIADEATTALDVTVQAQILDLLRELQDRLGMALVVITHDFGVVADICDRVAVMYAGQIIEQGDVRDVLYRPQHPYTQGLLDAVPRAFETAAVVGIAGTVPPPDALLTGCRFAPRCPYAQDECRVSEPELMATGRDAMVRCIRHSDINLPGVRRAV